jgi:phospholipid transport system substrate-binding protein
MKRSITTFLLVAIISITTSVQAKLASPYEVLETAGNNLFTRISSNQKELQKFPELMVNIVEEELMPHIDYQYAAYKILGKNLKKTTKEQRATFTKSMEQYLIRTYAGALKQYKNQQVIFEKDKPLNNQKIVSVKTKIVEPGRPDISIVFKMRKNRKTQEWKAYDMVVEGISLLSSKQAELNGRISKLGVDKVSTELAYLSK